MTQHLDMHSSKHMVSVKYPLAKVHTWVHHMIWNRWMSCGWMWSMVHRNKPAPILPGATKIGFKFLGLGQACPAGDPNDEIILFGKLWSIIGKLLKMSTLGLAHSHLTLSDIVWHFCAFIRKGLLTNGITRKWVVPLLQDSIFAQQTAQLFNWQQSNIMHPGILVEEGTSWRSHWNNSMFNIFENHHNLYALCPKFASSYDAIIPQREIYLRYP